MFFLSANEVDASGPVSTRPPVSIGASPQLLRSLLIIGCLASASIAAGLGEPSSFVQADPQLALLLRGMALIKGAIVLGAAAVCFWRLGHPVSGGTAAVYISGTATLAGAGMLIWQLSFIPLAALAFHVAALVTLIAAWRDGGAGFELLRRRSGSAHSTVRQRGLPG